MPLFAWNSLQCMILNKIEDGGFNWRRLALSDYFMVYYWENTASKLWTNSGPGCFSIPRTSAAFFATHVALLISKFFISSGWRPMSNSRQHHANTPLWSFTCNSNDCRWLRNTASAQLSNYLSYSSRRTLYKVRHMLAFCSLASLGAYLGGPCACPPGA